MCLRGMFGWLLAAAAIVPALEPGAIPCEGTAVCDDGNPCTTDLCLDGVCYNINFGCDDCDPCTIDYYDALEQCHHDPKDCGDGDPCTLDTCDPVTGECLHAPLDCDDGNPCTLDSCDPVFGCVHTPILCDDGNPCTEDLCDPLTGECLHAPLDCDDGDRCTVDFCDPLSGCIHVAEACDDDNACTTDLCNEETGACTYETVDCDDGDACTLDTCDVNTGCQHTPMDCDDQNACTAEHCDPLLGCVHTPVRCDDGDACTLDTCDPVLGCVHTEIDCDDADPCTQDICVPPRGCVHVPDPACEEGETPRAPPPPVHSADRDGDRSVQLGELLRVVQFFNSRGLHCDETTEDGYAPGPGPHDCLPHAGDYQEPGWTLSLSELLRVIQFYNFGGYHPCGGGEDGYCPWQAGRIFERRPGWNRPNLFVETLSLDPLWAESGGAVHLEAAVRNRGTGASDTAEVVFLVDGVEVARQPAGTLAPAASVMVTANWVAGPPGRYRAGARIQAFPAAQRAEPSIGGATAVGYVSGDPDETPAPEAQMRDPDALQLLPEETSEFIATISNPSPVDLGRVTVRSSINGAPVARNTLENLPAGGSQDIAIPWEALGPGQHLLQMEIEPEEFIPEDAFQRLVSYHFVVSGVFFNHLTPPWTSLGPRHIADSTNDLPTGAVGRVDTILFHPSNANTLYATAPWGGLWKSVNAGASWAPLSDTMENLHARGAALDPVYPDFIYLGTGHSVFGGGAGIFKSMDGGATWTAFARKVRDGTIERTITGVNRIEVRHVATGRVRIYAATDLGLLRYESTDPSAAVSTPAEWTITRERPVIDFQVSPADPNLLFISVKDEGIYRSTTGGAGATPWTKLNNPPVLLTAKSGAWFNFDVRWDAPRLIVATLSDPHSGVPLQKLGTLGMWRTGDDGATWTQLLLSSTDGLYNPFVRFAPTNENIIYFGGIKLYRYVQFGGNSIVAQVKGMHDDMTGFAWDPHDPVRTTYYVCTDGGIWRGVMGVTDVLAPINNDFRVTMFYDLDTAANNPNLMIGGTQDNGTIAWTGSPDWTAINGGDGDYVLIRLHDTMFYSQHQILADTKRCTLGLACTWKTWSPRNAGLPTDRKWGGGGYGGNDAFITSIWRDLSSALDIMAAQGDQVYLTFDGGVKWTGAGPSGPTVRGYVRRVTVQPTSNFLLAGTSEGQLWYAQVGGSWSLLWTHPDDATLASIVFSPVDARTAYLAWIGSARADRRIYRLYFDPAHPAAATLANITGNFPINLTPGVLCADGFRAGVCYAGTNKGGVYRYQDNNPAWLWEPYNNSFPWAAEVRDLVLDTASKELRAGTFGRGAWSVQPGP